MAKRGLLGEIIHQQHVANQRQARANQAAYAVAMRNQAKQEREAERARTAQSRTNAHNAIEADKAYKLAHIADQEAHVAELNFDLEHGLNEINRVINAGLESGGYIELGTLSTVVEHRAFDSPYLTPIKPPTPIQAPDEPMLVLPDPPKGFGGLFKKSDHAAAVLVAQNEHEQRHSTWQTEVAAIPMRQMEQMTNYAAAEEERERKLNLARLAYDLECVQRQGQSDEANARLDEFMAGLKEGKSDFVEEYIDMVFTRSEYPEGLEPSVKCGFDASTHELRIDLTFPTPDDMPQVKAHKYVKSGDVITQVTHTTKDLKDRYTFLICAMTLRSLHEVFDADRDGHIHPVSFIGGVMHVHEGIGKEVFTPLVHVALSRETFKEIDLSKVTSSETLKYLGGVVSKNPYSLEPVNVKAGVRSI